MAGLNLNLEISQPRGYAAKNGGVTFPRQAAKRAKANRERNGSVGQRWKLWTSLPRGYVANDRGGNLNAPVPRYGQA